MLALIDDGHGWPPGNAGDELSEVELDGLLRGVFDHISPPRPYEVPKEIKLRSGGTISVKDHQREAVRRAIEKNLLVNLKTGYGKTLIAVMLIDYFGIHQPGKKTLLVVPTRALVTQQAQYLRDHCSALREGMEERPLTVYEANKTLEPDAWQMKVLQYDVLVGTGEVFRRALNSGLTLEHFSLVVFDECHWASGEHPYYGLTTTIFSKYPSIRLLGLTACFAQGKIKSESDALEKKYALQRALQAELFSPMDLPKDSNEHLVTVPFDEETHLLLMKVAEAVRLAHLQLGRVACTYFSTESWEKVGKAARAMVISVGPTAYHHFASEVVVAPMTKWKETLERDKQRELQEAIDHFLRCLQNNVIEFARKEYHKLPSRSIIQMKYKELDANFDDHPILTMKATMLMEIIRKNIRKAEYDKRPVKGVVFAQLVAVIDPLVHIIDAFLHKGQKSLPVTGGGHMSDGEREKNIDDFRRKPEVVLLVATTALEEGLDVPDCSFVVRFDRVDTLRGIIQGAGRARHKDAAVYYFDNDPEDDQKRQIWVHQAANHRCEIIPRAPEVTLEGKYPYRHKDGSQIDIMNCVVIFSEYIQSVLQLSGSMEDYLFEVEEVDHHTGTPRRILQRVCVPTPDGVQYISSSDVSDFWGDLDYSKIFPSTKKKLAAFERMKRLILFLACVVLATDGHLTQANQASERARTATRNKCKGEFEAQTAMKRTLKLRNQEERCTHNLLSSRQPIFEDTSREGCDPDLYDKHLESAKAHSNVRELLQIAVLELNKCELSKVMKFTTEEKGVLPSIQFQSSLTFMNQAHIFGSNEYMIPGPPEKSKKLAERAVAILGYACFMARRKVHSYR